MLSQTALGAPSEGALALRPRDHRRARSAIRSRSSTRAGRRATRSCSSSKSARPSRRSSSYATSSGTTAMAGFDFAIAAWLWFTVLFANFAEAVAEGRGKAQADFLRRTKSDTLRALLHDDGTRGAGRPARALRKGDRFVVEAGEIIPADGDVHRRRGYGRRVGDHRRVGAGHPRIGRRPQRGHRRHARALRPHRRARHGQSRRELPRPHDSLGRRRAAAEDAQRNRALDPARRTDDHLPHRGCDARAVFDLCGHAAERHGADRVARLPDPDDDRRTALGDRHRRNGPRHAAQRLWR